MEIASNKIVNSVKIGGVEIDFKEVKEGNFERYLLSSYYLNTLSFIRDWLCGRETFNLQTSGSTGVPKVITVTREQLILSAEATVKALELSAGYSALVCLNTEYIAGTMMLVRSMILGMKMTISEPSSNPLDVFTDKDRFDFTALVPLQMENILSRLPEKEVLLNKFKSIIVGGAAISEQLKVRIDKVQVPVFATYGMTETLSHIALQRINGEHKEDYFTALDHVELSLDSRHCLVIKSPVTLGNSITTNDIVELIDEKRFRFLGRFDNVINSGGIKIFPEKIEVEVAKAIEASNVSRNYFVYGLPDEKLGEKVVLFIEGEPFKTEDLMALLKKFLSKYEVPKDIRFVPEFVMTGTGKINRRESVRTLGTPPAP